MPEPTHTPAGDENNESIPHGANVLEPTHTPAGDENTQLIVRGYQNAKEPTHTPAGDEKVLNQYHNRSS